MNPSQIDEDSDLLEVVFDDSALHVERHVESTPSHNLLYLLSDGDRRQSARRNMKEDLTCRDGN